MLPVSHFSVKRSGEIYKQCNYCREKVNEYNRNNRCIHGILKKNCRECDGTAYCKHNKYRAHCRECGGTAFCCHDKFKAQCLECRGSSICEHNTRRYRCKICNIGGYLRHRVMARMRNNPKFEWLGCSIEEFKAHLESTFKESMNWDVIDKIDIDHITPQGAKGISVEEKINRLHYKNTQLLWRTDNKRKGNSDSDSDIDSLTEQLNTHVTL